MGFAGISPGSLLLILLIVALLFGTKRLRNIGKDLGSAVRSFRQGLHDPTSDVPLENNSNDNQ
jgi:sec-independent protein translocase protein TatA